MSNPAPAPFDLPAILAAATNLRDAIGSASDEEFKQAAD
jgi:hypothetical protein